MKHKKLFWGIGIALGAVVLATVVAFLTGGSSQRAGTGFLEGAGIAPQVMLTGREAAPSFFGASPFIADKGAPQLPDRKIIRNGSLKLVVDAIPETADKIRAMVEGEKGFLSSLTVSDLQEGGKQGFMTIRVPAADFTKTMQELKALARVVEQESMSGEDVTEQFVDLDAQLHNLKATEAQLLDVLKGAHSVEDILKVRDRLSEVRGQIDQLEGRRRYLSNQTDLATISITLSEEPTVSLSLKDFRPATIFRTSVNALLQSLVVFFNIFLQAIIIWLPLALIAGGILALLWRLGRKIFLAFKK